MVNVCLGDDFDDLGGDARRGDGHECSDSSGECGGGFVSVV